jgi:uncharacterized membrane protein YccF (DUF307 family)
MSNDSGSPHSDSQSTVVPAEQHSLIVRAIWFIFVGWWATGIWLGIAWVLNVIIIGFPLGIRMINKTPYVATLKKRESLQIITQSGNDFEVTKRNPEQYSLLIRLLYFVLIGWWFSLVWIAIAYLFTVFTITLPLAFWMFDRLPFVTFLYRFKQ